MCTRTHTRSMVHAPRHEHSNTCTPPRIQPGRRRKKMLFVQMLCVYTFIYKHLRECEGESKKGGGNKEGKRERQVGGRWGMVCILYIFINAKCILCMLKNTKYTHKVLTSIHTMPFCEKARHAFWMGGNSPWPNQH